jgi:Zn-dependent membrane protease YugP
MISTAPRPASSSMTSLPLRQEKAVSAAVIGAAIAVLGLVGLVLARNAIDSGMNEFGWALFGFAVFFVLWLIKKHFDAIDQA